MYEKVRKVFQFKISNHNPSDVQFSQIIELLHVNTIKKKHLKRYEDERRKEFQEEKLASCMYLHRLIRVFIAWM